MQRLQISFKLHDSNYQEKTDKIVKYLNGYGFTCYASGAGFGTRDLDFEYTSLNKFIYFDLAEIHDYLDELLGYDLQLFSVDFVYNWLED